MELQLLESITVIFAARGWYFF